MSILDPEAFDQAADLIFNARQRDFYGIGGSAQIARDVAPQVPAHRHPHQRLRRRAHDADVGLAARAEGDVAIGFSHSGSTTAVIEPLELARRRGARTIAITNYGDSPLAAIADVVLCSTAQGSPLLGENAAARIAQLNIFDAVFVAVAQRDLEAAERNLASTMGAVPPRGGAR